MVPLVLWLSRPDPHRQRQGLHQSLRQGQRPSAVRQDLHQQRHRPHPDQAALADDDGQGGALPQDAARRVLEWQVLLLRRGRPGTPSTSGSTSTTIAGRIRRSARFLLINASNWPNRSQDRSRPAPPDPALDAGPLTLRRVGAARTISFATARYKAVLGGWPARPWRSSATAAWCRSCTVGCSSPPTLADTRSTSRAPASHVGGGFDSRPSATAASVTRKVDSSGNVCFAGTSYRVGSHLPPPPGAGGRGRRDRRDLDRHRAHPVPQGPPRPHPRARRSGQSRRPPHRINAS